MVNQSLYKRDRRPMLQAVHVQVCFEDRSDGAPGSPRYYGEQNSHQGWVLNCLRPPFIEAIIFFWKGWLTSFQPKQSFKLWTTCLFQILKLCQTIVKRPPIYHISYSHIGFLSGIPGIIHGPFWQDELW